MRFIRVGRHTLRIDLIEHVFEPSDTASGGTPTVFLRGRERGIELTPEEVVALGQLLAREHAASEFVARPGPGMAVTDPASDVAWYTVVGPWCRYDQDALLRARLAAVRRFYPGSRIMVQATETPTETNACWREATADLGIDWLTPRSFHSAGSEEDPISAMLEAYLDHARPAEFLFKFDLDTRVCRRFRWLPRGSVGVFGTLEYVAYSGFPYGNFPNVQGGCYGLSRETAVRVLGGGVLKGPELRADPDVWIDGIADWRGFAARGIICEDGLLRWVTKRMGLRPFGYDEIDSRFRRRPAGVNGDFAVTHPHKSLEPDEGGPPTARPPRRPPIAEGARRYFAACKELRPEYHRIADWLAARYKPEAVLDLGCGCAHILERFKELGVRVQGVDGSRNALEASPPAVRGDLKLADLRQPLDLDRFALVVCTGLAEFLPPESTDRLAETLAAHVGGHLLFSAAAPETEKRRRANSRSPSEWCTDFESRGLSLDEEATREFRSAMTGSALPDLPNEGLIFRRNSPTA